MSKSGRRTCSFLCGVAVNELESAQRICEAVGDSEHWATAVTMSDAISDYYRSLDRVGQKAREAGITREAWWALKGHKEAA